MADCVDADSSCDVPLSADAGGHAARAQHGREYQSWHSIGVGRVARWGQPVVPPEKRRYGLSNEGNVCDFLLFCLTALSFRNPESDFGSSFENTIRSSCASVENTKTKRYQKRSEGFPDPFFAAEKALHAAHTPHSHDTPLQTIITSHIRPAPAINFVRLGVLVLTSPVVCEL